MKPFWQNFLLIFAILGFLTNCSNFSSRVQKDTKLLIEYALYDFPFSPTSQIIEKETVILGSGERWSGKVRYIDTKSPAELLKFYAQVVTAAGWELKASTVSEGIFLVFNRDFRVATVEINRLSFFEGLKIMSPRTTSVTISVNYADTIGGMKSSQPPIRNKNLSEPKMRNQ